VKAAVTVEQEILNDQGMVCDFADIKACVEAYVDKHLDHNFLLHKDDPLIPALQDHDESFWALEEHPTAEVLSKMIFQHIKAAGFNVTQVVLWETASAYACYRED
jgi:6-pyruvoyltetrahydropterin/6-carboxytetrahydropterin synthase